MGPIFDPSLAGKLVRHEPPFVEDSPRLPYPNFYYALEDLVASYSPALTFSVHRSSIIIGASSRSVYNALLSLAVYAAICKQQRLPFHYPVSWHNNKYGQLCLIRLRIKRSIAKGFDLVEMMKEKGGVWDEIVEKHGLYKTKLEEITCFDALKIAMNFDFQHVCSMTKSREFGFHGFADTFKSIRMWVERLRDMKIIP
ncbi:hypothetical protein Pint_25772 [Pistacia integerrima]|uniref:Uncharacterized protein n=1 Tax=Pistacia integerrima TaxID=434235 RepID=A0ACC0YDF7_9ROSI|nr:hypothetical protein Pint_25772 [Pistacia integerrima]